MFREKIVRILEGKTEWEEEEKIRAEKMGKFHPS